MSLYYVQKLIYQINRDENIRRRFDENFNDLLVDYELSDEEIHALKKPDIGLLYVLGVNGQLLMHYAPLFGIEWFDYLAAMKQGIEEHGPVRAGLYAMTGGGKSFAKENE
ncbi:MAG: aromatic ring-opening dioxygenase subunit LigA [SAR324 cluster bacterium]|nr:aromatic ring-opening dioxygenase subunit LigA [SAR324 cluster bacterium]